MGKADTEEVGVYLGGAKYFIALSIAHCDWVVYAVNAEPHSHCTLVPENCQKIAGVPSVWTQTRPGINSGIDPGLGPSNIAGFSPGTSAVWTKAGSMP